MMWKTYRFDPTQVEIIKFRPEVWSRAAWSGPVSKDPWKTSA